MLTRMIHAVAVVLFFVSAPSAFAAADCLAMAGNVPRVHLAALEADQVQLTYLGHSTFLIETAGGTRIATDFTGYAGGVMPDAVTMNRAHSSHYTDFPDPAIKHVLRGWDPEGGIARHDVEVGDVRIRNVTTDIRRGDMRIPNANSIFVFEVAGLCIGHLGHLHHELNLEHLGAIGRLDVVLVPVDGGYTMAQTNMLEVLKSLKARVVIPMHYFGPSTLARFIANVGGVFELQTMTEPTLVLSASTLPDKPKLIVLPGY